MFHFDFEHVMTEFLIEHTKTYYKIQSILGSIVGPFCQRSDTLE